MADKKYNFRKELITPNIRFKYALRDKSENEISLLSGVPFAGDILSSVVNHAVKDFKDYLKVCFGVNEVKQNAVI